MDQTGNLQIPSQSKPTRNVGRIGRLFSGVAVALVAMMYLLRPG
jgi:hypothetical protein